MSDLIYPHFPIFVMTFTLSLVVSLVVLKLIDLSTHNFLPFLHIPSGKSATNARLLGGLAIGLALLSSLVGLFYLYPGSLSLHERETLMYSLISVSIVMIYGYADDKFEIRVRYKLGLQVASIILFSFLNAHNISDEHPLMGFAVSSVFGLAFVNGTNLLDGLDTLSIKLGGSTSLAYLFLGVIAHSTLSIYLSIILLSSLSIFYFYNREPAKIYMGEIGGSVIGLIFFIQSSLCYTNLKTQMSSYDAFAFVLIAGCLPLCELGISFLRRIYSKRSPFRGDRLHLHYILKSKYKLSASDTAGQMAKFGSIIIWSGMLLAQFKYPLIAFTLVVLSIVHFYFWFCLDVWRDNTRKENAKNLFELFKGKPVHIIDSNKFSNLHIDIIEKDKAA